MQKYNAHNYFQHGETQHVIIQGRFRNLNRLEMKTKSFKKLNSTIKGRLVTANYTTLVYFVFLNLTFFIDLLILLIRDSSIKHYNY